MPIDADFGDEFRREANRGYRQTNRLRESIDRLNRTIDQVSRATGGGGGGGRGGGLGFAAGAAVGGGATGGASYIYNRYFGKNRANFAGNTASMHRSLGRLATVAGTAAAVGIAAIGVTAAAVAAGPIARARIEQDRLSAAIAVFTGNQQKANIAYERFATISDEVGAHAKSNIAAFGLLAAAAKGNVNSFRDLEDIYKGVVTASAAFHLGAQEQQRALVAIQQSFSKGKIQSEELVGQLAEALPGAITIAQKAFVALGGSADNFFRAMERGELSPERFFPEFGRQLSAEHAEQAARNADKISGSLNKLANTWDNLMRSLAIGLPGDIITFTLSKLTTFIAWIDRTLVSDTDRVNALTSQLSLYKSQASVPHDITKQALTYDSAYPRPPRSPRPELNIAPFTAPVRTSGTPPVRPTDPVLPPYLSSADKRAIMSIHQSQMDRYSRELGEYFEQEEQSIQSHNRKVRIAREAYDRQVELQTQTYQRELAKWKKAAQPTEMRQAIDKFWESFNSLPGTGTEFGVKLSRDARNFFDNLVDEEFRASAVTQGRSVFMAHRPAGLHDPDEYLRRTRLAREVTSDLSAIRNPEQFNALLSKSLDQFGGPFKQVPFAEGLKDLTDAKKTYSMAVVDQIETDRKAAQAVRELERTEYEGLLARQDVIRQRQAQFREMAEDYRNFFIEQREASVSRIASTTDRLAQGLGEFSTLNDITELHKIKDVFRNFAKNVNQSLVTEIYRVTITDPLKQVIKGFMDGVIQSFQTGITNAQYMHFGQAAFQAVVSAFASKGQAPLPMVPPGAQGPFHQGGTVGFNERLARVKVGESILTTRQLSNLRPAQVQPMKVYVTNNVPEAQVQVDQDAQGNTTIDIFGAIDEAMSQVVAKPGNFQEAILGLTGAKRQVLSRG